MPIENLELPLTVDSKFSVCMEGDGANVVEYSIEDNFAGSGEVEWIAKSSDELIIQAVSPMGQPIYQLKYHKESNNLNAIDYVGLAPTQLGVDNDGFLEVDGNFVPVKIEELPCLLRSQYPKTWLRNVVGKSLRDKFILIRISEDKRTIKMKIGLDNKIQTDCAKISWRRFLFLKYEFLLCLNQNSAGFLKFEDKFEAKWKRLD